MIDSTDLVAYSAASVPEDDVSTSGGARSTTSRPALTQLSANAVPAAVSDGADTRTITFTGRLPSGVIDTEALVLDGANEVVGAKTFERYLKVELSGTDAARTVTVRQGAGGATIATIAPDETKRHIFFQRSVSDASPSVRYEKLFWRNQHGTLSLTNAKVTLTADPASKIEIGLAAAKDDSGSVADRLTAPGGVTFVDDGVEQDVPSGALAAGEAIGVWIEQSLGANEAPQKSSFTTRLAGTTT
jgi:hypothetical protein